MARKTLHSSTSSTPGFARILIAIAVLFSLFLIGSFIALLFGADTDEYGANTAVIRIIGPISGNDAGFFADSGASSTVIVEQLRKARDDETITGVVLEINSPGGSAVASDEIAQAVKEIRANGKPVVAWIRESGASGAYWIASASDHVVANRMSITGSIGVIGSYMEFDEFLDEWNISYNRLFAGERKDIGDPFVDLTPQKAAFLQKKIDKIHEFFILEVAENRNMSIDTVRPLADGSFYLGVEALELGLIDEVGGENEAVAYIESRTGHSVSLVVYEEEAGLFDDLFGIIGRSSSPSVEDLLVRREAESSYGIASLR